MQSPFFLKLFLFPLFILAQQTLPEFDGQITPKEWSGAETFEINYEIDPGNNVASPHLTKVFITYSETDLYVGFIARTTFDFQFNPNLSFRLIGEFNNFDDAYFLQPLLKWNPNPFTIFYIGGTNGYSKIDTQNQFRIENSQLYLKFQYLFDF